ncbi:MAG: 4Fe-4S dicluster domain-containing protein, partial [Oligoflexia bacterium]|nr:4Fe-4S dicluster domain-containing protein [Oligoflexia bacterium]
MNDNNLTKEAAKCYQCGKCFAGCPLSSVMELSPTQIMRLLQIGEIEKVLQANTLWVCVACETCESRCPQQIKLVHHWDVLRNRLLNDRPMLKRFVPKEMRRVILAH